jgi:hypothetical protein
MAGWGFPDVALPQRAPKPEKPKREKRDGRFKSLRHRDWVRKEFACVMCGSTVGRQFAHVRIGALAGMSRKPDDWRGVVLCADDHQYQHDIGEETFWREYAAKHGQSVWQLIDSLCAASPVAHEIRQWRMEHENG